MSGPPALLFIDDDQAILDALRVVFREGYQVVVTTDVAQAVEWLGGGGFDVVVCDERMPHMSGIDVLKASRQRSPGTVRILLTGYTDQRAVVQAINDAEVHRYLCKPWDNAALRRAVDEAVLFGRHLKEGAAAADDACSTDAEPPATPASVAGVLVAGASGHLATELETECGNTVSIGHVESLAAADRYLSEHAAGVLVCAFDLTCDADRLFIQVVKHRHPSLMVIAMCDRIDSTSLIDLINHTRIFRYIRTPVNVRMLAHYVASAQRMLAHGMGARHPAGPPHTERPLPYTVIAPGATSLHVHREAAHKPALGPLQRFRCWFGKRLRIRQGTR